MATEIPLIKEEESNGGREALMDIVETLPGRDVADAEFLCDWMLLELAVRGFVIAPLRLN